MAEVSVHIGGRDYHVHCKDGEEAHLARLVAMVDAKTTQARQSSSGLTEVRQLLFAAILLADEVTEEQARSKGPQPSLDIPPPSAAEMDEPLLIARINAMAARIESLAKKIGELSA